MISAVWQVQRSNEVMNVKVFLEMVKGYISFYPKKMDFPEPLTFSGLICLRNHIFLPIFLEPPGEGWGRTEWGQNIS